MILIDALYINNSGGKVLLDYLIEAVEASAVEAVYLLDERIRDNHPAISENKVIYLDAGIANRYQFYKKYKNDFSTILCFGNLGPAVKTNATVYTYFHQKLFLEIPKTFTFKQKLTFQLKSLIFKFLLKNTDYLMVQTQVVKDDFLAKVNLLNPQNIILLPFYPQIKSIHTGKIDRKKHSFVYISSGSPHKNHKRLLTAFVNFYNLHKTGELRLTVSEDYLDLLIEVQDLQRKGYPIVNYGLMPREALADIYSSSEYCIYPSLSESFGLGIIEAVEGGCKIIGADLPYTNAVCKPSLRFNPLDSQSIVVAFEKAINNEGVATEQKVFNEIDKLIAILKTGTC